MGMGTPNVMGTPKGMGILKGMGTHWHENGDLQAWTCWRGDLVAWGTGGMGNSWHRDLLARGLGDMMAWIVWGPTSMGNGDFPAWGPAGMGNGDLVAQGCTGMGSRVQEWGPKGMGTCWPRDLVAW